jgi:type IV pilus assembly protein PilB
MTHYDRLKRKRLGDILVDEGVASKDAVISALHEQQRCDKLLSDLLVESRELTEYELSRVLVEQFQAPFIDLRGYTFHRDLIEQFPARLMHAARVIPLDRFGDQVCFACQEIPSEEVAEQLREQASGGMYFYIASSVEIRACLAEHAPLRDEDLEGDTSVKPVLGPEDGAESEDSAWQNLFDSANDAILHELEPSGGEETD